MGVLASLFMGDGLVHAAESMAGTKVADVAKSVLVSNADILAALPDNPSEGRRVQAAWVVRDLKRVVNFYGARRALLNEIPLGVEYHAEKQAFDFLGEVSTLIRILAPAVQEPVELALAVYADEKGYGAQLVGRASKGVLARLRAAKKDSFWHFEPTPQDVKIFQREYEGQRLTASYADGWLRINVSFSKNTGPAVAPGLPGKSRSLTFTSTDLQRRLNTFNTYMFVRKGRLLELVTKRLEDRTVGPLLASMRTLVLGSTWSDVDYHSMKTQLLIDSPLLEQFEPMVRIKALDNAFTRLWGKDAEAFLSVSIPPAVVGMAPALLFGQPKNGLLGDVSGLQKLLATIEGRLGFVHFGPPGDWAAAMRFQNAESATKALPALRSFVRQVNHRELKKLAKGLTEETWGPDATSVLHFQLARSLDGVRFAAIGDVVVAVNQKARLEALLNRSRKGGTSDDLAGTLSASMREMLNDPAIVCGYTLLGADGSLVMLYAQMMGWLKDALQDTPPGLAMFSEYMQQMPTELALAAFELYMTYDLGVSFDLQDGIIELTWATSSL